jgi:hypothetical protein
MNTALGAARALLARSYLPVQNAALSARNALRIALREDDGNLAELARARLLAAHRPDLIRDAERQEPFCTDGVRRTVRVDDLRVEVHIAGVWRQEGDAAPHEEAVEHYDRLCRALRGHGEWARQHLDLCIDAVRLVDDRGCYAYWSAE